MVVCTGSTTTIDPGTTSTTTTPGGRGTTSTTEPGEAIHGCTLANATDSTAPSANRTTTISNYSFSFPKCRRIAVGQSVLFVGQFSNHPLVGGQVVGGVETPDPASPLTNAADSGPNQKTATFPNAGVFPFYCDEHAADFGMVGVIFVE